MTFFPLLDDKEPTLVSLMMLMREVIIIIIILGEKEFTDACSN